MKVGDYVRYKDAFNNTIKVRRINEIIPPDKLIKANVYFFNKKECALENDIIKSSPNIIDLIEVGDYVDGLKVIDIVEHLHGHKDIVMTNGKFQWSMSNDDYDIKSIVTKEQFESMKYEVK